MRFILEVGNQEKTRIEFYRNWWWGTTRITSNGRIVTTTPPCSLLTHFNLGLVKHYEFVVGEQEKHRVVIERERPLLLPGFRPHTYRVYLDKQLIEEHRGF